MSIRTEQWSHTEDEGSALTRIAVVDVQTDPRGGEYVEVAYEVFVSMLRQLGYDRADTP